MPYVLNFFKNRYFSVAFILSSIQEELWHADCLSKGRS